MVDKSIQVGRELRYLAPSQLAMQGYQLITNGQNLPSREGASREWFGPLRALASHVDLIIVAREMGLLPSPVLDPKMGLLVMHSLMIPAFRDFYSNQYRCPNLIRYHDRLDDELAKSLPRSRVVGSSSWQVVFALAEMESLLDATPDAQAFGSRVFSNELESKAITRGAIGDGFAAAFAVSDQEGKGDATYSSPSTFEGALQWLLFLTQLDEFLERLGRDNDYEWKPAVRDHFNFVLVQRASSLYRYFSDFLGEFEAWQFESATDEEREQLVRELEESSESIGQVKRTLARILRGGRDSTPFDPGTPPSVPPRPTPAGREQYLTRVAR